MIEILVGGAVIIAFCLIQRALDFVGTTIRDLIFFACFAAMAGGFLWLIGRFALALWEAR